MARYWDSTKFDTAAAEQRKIPEYGTAVGVDAGNALGVTFAKCCFGPTFETYVEACIAILP